MKDAIARMPPGLPNTATRCASGTIHPAYRWRRSQRIGVVACGAFHFWWRDGGWFWTTLRLGLPQRIDDYSRTATVGALKSS